MELTVDDNTDAAEYLKQWEGLRNTEPPKFDVVLLHTNAKIRRMSPRRQKIAMLGKPATVLKNCSLVSCEAEETTGALSSFNVTMEYDSP